VRWTGNKLVASHLQWIETVMNSGQSQDLAHQASVNDACDQPAYCLTVLSAIRVQTCSTNSAPNLTL